ncbi:MAG: glycerol-3-phosphate dehydrogenase C-terminal domain-containing protein, partial [Thalassolituus sp.]
VWTDPRVVSVSGGKLTTFRLIARDVLEAAKPWLTDCNLDGGQRVFRAASLSENFGLPASVVRRLTGFYGAEAQELLDSADASDLVKIPGTSVLWAELRWAAESEAVVHLDDLLLRRTRIGLLVPQGGLTHTERLRTLLQPVLGWSDDQWEAEVSRYREIWERYYWLPAQSVVTEVSKPYAEHA